MHDMGSTCGKSCSSTVKNSSYLSQSNDDVKVEGMFSDAV